MLIIGGEPPVVENPEPRFNAVILKLNQLAEAVRSATELYNDTVEGGIGNITSNINDFVNNAGVDIDAHLAARHDPQHNETKASIGLSKRDNYRTATVEECKNFSPVLAFVTPFGAHAAIVDSNNGFDPSLYQQNGILPFGSFYYPDEYPTLTPTQVEPSRFFGPNRNTGILFNDDRLVFSPISDTAQYQTQTVFNSLPTSKSKGGRLAEVPNLSENFLTAAWNPTGCDTSAGNVSFFKALADKKIYSFTNGLTNLAAGNRNYILYNSYSSMTYKGLAVSTSSSGTTVTINHRFFYVNNVATAPTLTELITSSYRGTFDRFDTPQYSAAASGSQTFDIKNYVTLPTGAVMTIEGGSHGIVASLLWNIQDVEIYLHLAVPVKVTLNGTSQRLIFSFIQSIKPGTLASGGMASFTQLGTRAKDTLGTDLLPVGTGNWFSDGNLYNMLNVVQYPGVLLKDTGELVKAATGKYGIHVKRVQSPYTDAISYLKAKGGFIDPITSIRELYCPARHAPFGLLPERIIPYLSDSVTTGFLVFGQNPSNGRYAWKTCVWNGGNIVSTETSGKFGIRLPDVVLLKQDVALIPSYISVYTSASVAGVTLSGLVFTEGNNYTGVNGLGYDGFTVNSGDGIRLDNASLAKLRVSSAGVLSRAAVGNPAVDNNLRKIHIQVFRLTPTKSIVVFSDGVCYAEAGVCNSTLSGSSFVLDFDNTGGSLKLFPVTQVGQTISGVNLTSKSGDGVWMPFSDILISSLGNDAFNFVVTRAFSDTVYGDIGFTLNNMSGSSPVFAPDQVNPGRLYSGTDAFDCVEELYPAICIPQKGIYQYLPSNTAYTTVMKEVGGARTVDPYDINETGWVRIPSGTRVVLNGKTLVLDQNYAVKVPATGTAYCYLQLAGTVLKAVSSTVYRQPVNSEVLFGISTNGILTINKSYVLLNGRVISSSRRGSTIPSFQDDGASGVNQYFTKRDVK